MKYTILTLVFASSVCVQAKIDVTCVASKLVHQTMTIKQDENDVIRIQKYFEGKVLGEELVARVFDSERPGQYILVGKGGVIDYLRLSPGALNPQSPSRRSHALLSSQLDASPDDSILYNCLK